MNSKKVNPTFKTEYKSFKKQHEENTKQFFQAPPTHNPTEKITYPTKMSTMEGILLTCTLQVIMHLCPQYKEKKALIKQLIIQLKDTNTMHVTYASVYYFSILIMMLTAGLCVFAVRKIRRVFFNFTNKHNLSNNPILTAIVYIAFALIFIILADSVMTYASLKDQLEDDSKHMVLDQFEAIKKSQREDYLIMYRRYREFYMAERNFMLTSSALLVYFIFSRMVVSLNKLHRLQNQIQSK